MLGTVNTNWWAVGILVKRTSLVSPRRSTIQVAAKLYHVEEKGASEETESDTGKEASKETESRAAVPCGSLHCDWESRQCLTCVSDSLLHKRKAGHLSQLQLSFQQDLL